jgi:hypothetical protein
LRRFRGHSIPLVRRRIATKQKCSSLLRQSDRLGDQRGREQGAATPHAPRCQTFGDRHMGAILSDIRLAAMASFSHAMTWEATHVAG